MTPYEAAVSMYKSEHSRWNQWALFFFGSIASVFVISERIEEFVPPWVPAAVACLVSILWVLVSTAIRRSSEAWRKTLRDIERSKEKESAQPFVIQKEYYDNFNVWKDLKPSLFSVTYHLRLLGVIATISFLVLAVQLRNEPASSGANQNSSGRTSTHNQALKADPR